MIRIVVFISGRGSNFISLHNAVKAGHIAGEIVAVFSNNPNAVGLSYAEKEGIPTVVIPSKGRKDRQDYDLEVIDAISSYKPDLICLAGYMRIVTEKLVNAYKDKIMNIHPALLPSFCGLDAQKQALDYGVRISGCTVHFVDCGVDSGPIILQKAVPVYCNDTEESLSERILFEEHKLYPEAVGLFAQGKLKVCGRQVEIVE